MESVSTGTGCTLLTMPTGESPGVSRGQPRASAVRGALVAGALLAAACGGGSGDSETGRAEPEATKAAAESPTATPAPATTRAATTAAPPGTEPATESTAPTTDAPDNNAADPAETQPPTADEATEPRPATTQAVAETEGPATAPTTEPAAPTTDTPAEATTPAAAPVVGRWERVIPGDGCVCADGSPYSFWVREADPSRVVLHLMGGGACFNFETCSLSGVAYTATVDASAESPGGGGIFDLDNPANPLAGHSFVVVPYCTGDLHLGTTTAAYGRGLTVNHTGFLNASKALDEMADRFGGPAEVVVTGSSAGSAAAPLFGGLVSDLYPEAKVAVVADSSGAYPDNPTVNAEIGGRWGVDEALPDWPVNQGLTIADIGLPGLFVQTGRHHPDIRFSRFDHAFDLIQALFTTLSGGGVGPTDRMIRDNEDFIESRGVPMAGYLAPGPGHTILGQPEMYNLEVEGTAFIDWLTAFLAGESVGDVRCRNCILG